MLSLFLITPSAKEISHFISLKYNYVVHFINSAFHLRAYEYQSDKEIQETLIKTLEGHDGTIRALTLLKNGYLASGCYDKTIKIWNYKENKERSLVDTLEEHEGIVLALNVLENGFLVSGSADGTIKIWDVT